MHGKLVASSNGLLCFCSSSAIYICNPLTKDSVELPKLSSESGILGFGFSPTTKEYKVLDIIYQRKMPRSNSLLAPFQSKVRIFTLGDSQWRSLGMAPYQFIVRQSQVTVCGRLHWISQDVLALRGHLCVAVSNADCGLDIWVMKEYNVKESWVKEFIIGARDLLVCLLGRVESPSKRSVDLLSRDLVRDGRFVGWLERDEKRTGIGVSSKLWHGLASDGGNCRRFLMSGCFTGEESELRAFLSLHSLSSSAKDLAYPDSVSIVLSVLKVSKELLAVEPLSLFVRPSIFVLVALGFTLLSKFGKAKPCSLYAHGLKDGTEIFSLAKRKEIIEAIIGGIIEPGTFDAVFSDLEDIKADDPAKGHPHGV
ncbi:hypothetical protein V6N13_078681 [Hibiscus sabdariffa]